MQASASFSPLFCVVSASCALRAYHRKLKTSPLTQAVFPLRSRSDSGTRPKMCKSRAHIFLKAFWLCLVKPDYLILSGQAVGPGNGCRSLPAEVFYCAIFISKKTVKVMAQPGVWSGLPALLPATEDCREPQLVSPGQVEDTLTLHPGS